jgi:hypothetical protein
MNSESTITGASCVSERGCSDVVEELESPLFWLGGADSAADSSSSGSNSTDLAQSSSWWMMLLPSRMEVMNATWGAVSNLNIS